MKLTSALLAISMASVALASKQEERAVRTGGRALGKGKGGKGGKGKGGCGKGKAEKCPEGTVWVEYDIKFNKDYDRETELISPHIDLFPSNQFEPVAIYDIDSSVFLQDTCGNIGCVPDDTDYQFEIEQSHSAYVHRSRHVLSFV